MNFIHHDNQARNVVNALRCEWRRIARNLADPAIELDADEFGAVLDVYTRLKSLGAKIDPMAEMFITQGCFSLVCTLTNTYTPGKQDSAYLRGVSNQMRDERIIARRLLCDDPEIQQDGLYLDLMDASVHSAHDDLGTTEIDADRGENG